MNKILKKLQDIGSTCAGEIGYELVEVTVNSKISPLEVDFIVYHPDGVLIDDCAIISKNISDYLDSEDIFHDQYQLNVSSPGLDRPIESSDDLRRNMGKLLEVNLYTLLEGKKHFEGILVGHDEEKIVLEQEDGVNIEIDRKNISLLRQLIIF